MPWHEAAALGHEAPSLKGWFYSISYMCVLICFNSNLDDTKAIGVGRSGCACGAQKVRVWWGGVGRHRCYVVLV